MNKQQSCHVCLQKNSHAFYLSLEYITQYVKYFLKTEQNQLFSSTFHTKSRCSNVRSAASRRYQNHCCRALKKKNKSQELFRSQTICDVVSLTCCTAVVVVVLIPTVSCAKTCDVMLHSEQKVLPS